MNPYIASCPVRLTRAHLIVSEPYPFGSEGSLWLTHMLMSQSLISRTEALCSVDA
ncbi:hypothetical protein M440DRAFT_1396800 [Trichoderma longibrachiatum ATCC 18648]|uniref:Uncharacterized protein n=1 Tax=Trichoderma longibrachiatum ATCC 18648 TaxID=983965 RepID=A0A2T4CJ88_TRILO|nr:hypothetical protein M440DRAFT_1396800 [Trichoderma longibrachiatum ATCC 18648]